MKHIMTHNWRIANLRFASDAKEYLSSLNRTNLRRIGS